MRINKKKHTHTRSQSASSPCINQLYRIPAHCCFPTGSGCFRLTARRTLIDDATTQAGGAGVRLALIGGSGDGTHPGTGGAYGEMVETASAYANATDGLDNLGYAHDTDDKRNERRRRQQQQQLQQQQPAMSATPSTPQPHQPQHQQQQRHDDAKRNGKPVIHFPKPPAGSPSSRYACGQIDGFPVQTCKLSAI